MNESVLIVHPQTDQNYYLLLFSTEALLAVLLALAFISSVREKHFNVLFLFPVAAEVLLLLVAAALLAPMLNRLLWFIRLNILRLFTSKLCALPLFT